jgi:hypothetical protein
MRRQLAARAPDGSAAAALRWIGDGCHLDGWLGWTLGNASGLMLLCNAQRTLFYRTPSVPFCEVIIQWQKV